MIQKPISSEDLQNKDVLISLVLELIDKVNELEASQPQV